MKAIIALSGLLSLSACALFAPPLTPAAMSYAEYARLSCAEQAELRARGIGPPPHPSGQIPRRCEPRRPSLTP